jgi:hypothetical protein
MELVCLDCGEVLENLPELNEIGEVIECQACGAEMELINLEPVQLKLIVEEK